MSRSIRLTEDDVPSEIVDQHLTIGEDSMDALRERAAELSQLSPNVDDGDVRGAIVYATFKTARDVTVTDAASGDSDEFDRTDQGKFDLRDQTKVDED